MSQQYPEPDLVRIVVPSLDGTFAILAGRYLIIAADAPAGAENAALAASRAGRRIESGTNELDAV